MSRVKGNLAEEQACKHLLALGFTIVERNCYSRFGEIDIITQKGDVLHFVEVKSAPDYESAINNITPKKLSRVVKTAHAYMKKKAADCDFCIDAVIVTSDKIELLENITI